MGMTGKLAVGSAAGSATEPIPAWREELAGCQTSYDVFRVARRFANAFGYGFFMVAADRDEPLARLANSLIINNLHPDLVRAYDEFGFMVDSPLFAAVSASVEPVCWDLRSIGGKRDPERTRTLQELLSSFNIAAGVYFPVHASNSRKGIVGLLGDGQALPVEDIPSAGYVATLLFNRLVEIEARDNPSAPVLTERERECLYWTAAGKTSTEIGRILGISLHTVDHYLTTAGQKLDTVNRAHTVATALRRGLIK